ncbi:DUF397 domain-containing protein [Streptomyces sp. NPDC058657]|uniref:DUF397 domain-containing protein n=1 Tax=unclassified Streptomyces TaxID=2593676 RepID=UPI0036686C37
MTALPEFAFVKTQACRDAKVDNCAEVATNRPDVVAVRSTLRPNVVVEFSREEWVDLTAAVSAGEFTA